MPMAGMLTARVDGCSHRAFCMRTPPSLTMPPQQLQSFAIRHVIYSSTLLPLGEAAAAFIARGIAETLMPSFSLFITREKKIR